eukprot:TRINITY_DN48_c0_g1_i1.p1 TRINITY_DN48_c0_g1~~TRINITY_DN48_c0_g1_i1.p1  ORF type:complete len:987 (-),score=291.78 TRINITY_DN48_c0_g1_i1:62-3022(-)
MEVSVDTTPLPPPSDIDASVSEEATVEDPVMQSTSTPVDNDNHDADVDVEGDSAETGAEDALRGSVDGSNGVAEHVSEPGMASPAAVRGRKRRTADAAIIANGSSATEQSPDLSKRVRSSPQLDGDDASGRSARVRKPNPAFVDYAMDKKTPPSKPVVVLASPHIQSASGPLPVIRAFKKEIIQSPIADPLPVLKKTLPKGFVLAPIVERPKEDLILTGKRDRKKVVVTDYVTPTTPHHHTPAAESSSKKKRGRKANPTPHTPKYASASHSSDALVQTPAHDRKSVRKSKNSDEKQYHLESKIDSLNNELANLKHSIAARGEPPVEPGDVVDRKRPPHTSPTLGSHTPVLAGRSQRPKKPKHASGYTSDTPTVPEQFRKVHDVILHIMAHKHSWPFNQPVKPLELGIPDYFTFVKEPMDLGTVKERIQDSYYNTLDEIVNDVNLVWYNARLYNDPTSDIVYMAGSLSKIFDDKVARLYNRPAVGSPANGAGKKTMSMMEERIFQLTASLEHVTAEIERMKKQKDEMPSPVSPKMSNSRNRAPRDDLRPLSFDDKRRLSVSINQLPPESLGKVVQIIHERMPRLAKTSAPDEIEIDIDALDNGTLHTLDRYVKGAIAKTQKKSSDFVDRARKSTQQKMQQVQQQLAELRGTKPKAGGRKRPPPKANGPEEDVDIVGDMEGKPPQPPASVVKDEDSSSGSSDSESDSDSSSGSDSESDSSDSSSSEDESQEVTAPSIPATAPAKPPTTSSSTTTTTSTPAPTTAPSSQLYSNTNSTSSTTQPSSTSDKVVFGLEKPPVHTSASLDDSGKAPEILPTTSRKAVDITTPVMASWGSALQGSDSSRPADASVPTAPPPSSGSSSDPMWSQFQNKNILLQQKEKERQEQEERDRVEREERDASRRREEERRRNDQLEEERRKSEEAEAAVEDQKRAIAAKRQAEREAREQLQSKSNLLHQSNVMATFEKELVGGDAIDDLFNPSSLSKEADE